MSKLEPKTPFDGWILKYIEDLDNKLDEFMDRQDKYWTNHIKHHEKLESRLLYWGISLVGISAFIGWIIKSIIN